MAKEKVIFTTGELINTLVTLFLKKTLLQIPVQIQEFRTRLQNNGSGTALNLLLYSKKWKSFMLNMALLLDRRQFRSSHLEALRSQSTWVWPWLGNPLWHNWTTTNNLKVISTQKISQLPAVIQNKDSSSTHTQYNSRNRYTHPIGHI